MSINADSLNQIKTLLGPAGFIDDPAQMGPYVVSWRNRWTGQSPLIALPATTEQVAGIIRICQRYHIAVVPQGGNTGLVDGGVPSKQGNEIVLSLSRMNKIREIDVIGSTITVEAGMILRNLKDAAEAAGCLFPMSMASEGSAQIGGAISTNAGGTAVLRYGNTRDLVMGLEVVLPNGDMISNLKKPAKDNTGYNLAQYFCGAEGTLGIVTAATLKLFPAIKQELTSVVAIENAGAALKLLHIFRQEAGEYLSAFEIMSHAALQLVMKHIPDTRYPGRGDAPYYLLIELGSTSHHADLRAIFEDIAVQALENNLMLDAVIAENTTQAKQFWHLREHIPEAVRTQGNSIHFDIALPLDQLADFLVHMPKTIAAIAPNMVLVPFGHIGDGNLHYNMVAPMLPEDFATLKKQIQTAVYSEIKRRQGSISAEHGIGVERKAELLKVKSPAVIGLMKTIKSAVDPQNIMNPGKIFD